MQIYIPLQAYRGMGSLQHKGQHWSTEAATIALSENRLPREQKNSKEQVGEHLPGEQVSRRRGKPMLFICA